MGLITNIGAIGKPISLNQLNGGTCQYTWTPLPTCDPATGLAQQSYVPNEFCEVSNSKLYNLYRGFGSLIGTGEVSGVLSFQVNSNLTIDINGSNLKYTDGNDGTFITVDKYVKYGDFRGFRDYYYLSDGSIFISDPPNGRYNNIIDYCNNNGKNAIFVGCCLVSAAVPNSYYIITKIDGYNFQGYWVDSNYNRITITAPIDIGTPDYGFIRAWNGTYTLQNPYQVNVGIVTYNAPPPTDIPCPIQLPLTLNSSIGYVMETYTVFKINILNLTTLNANGTISGTAYVTFYDTNYYINQQTHVTLNTVNSTITIAYPNFRCFYRYDGTSFTATNFTYDNTLSVAISSPSKLPNFIDSLNIYNNPDYGQDISISSGTVIIYNNVSYVAIASVDAYFYAYGTGNPSTIPNFWRVNLPLIFNSSSGIIGSTYFILSMNLTTLNANGTISGTAYVTLYNSYINQQTQVTLNTVNSTITITNPIAVASNSSYGYSYDGTTFTIDNQINLTYVPVSSTSSCNPVESFFRTSLNNFNTPDSSDISINVGQVVMDPSNRIAYTALNGIQSYFFSYGTGNPSTINNMWSPCGSPLPLISLKTNYIYGGYHFTDDMGTYMGTTYYYLTDNHDGTALLSSSFYEDDYGRRTEYTYPSNIYYDDTTNIRITPSVYNGTPTNIFKPVSSISISLSSSPFPPKDEHNYAININTSLSSSPGTRPGSILIMYSPDSGKTYYQYGDFVPFSLYQTIVISSPTPLYTITIQIIFKDNGSIKFQNVVSNILYIPSPSAIQFFGDGSMLYYGYNDMITIHYTDVAPSGLWSFTPSGTTGQDVNIIPDNIGGFTCSNWTKGTYDSTSITFISVSGTIKKFITDPSYIDRTVSYGTLYFDNTTGTYSLPFTLTLDSSFPPAINIRWIVSDNNGAEFAPLIGSSSLITGIPVNPPGASLVAYVQYGSTYITPRFTIVGNNPVTLTNPTWTNINRNVTFSWSSSTVPNPISRVTISTGIPAVLSSSSTGTNSITINNLPVNTPFTISVITDISTTYSRTYTIPQSYTISAINKNSITISSVNSISPVITISPTPSTSYASSTSATGSGNIILTLPTKKLWIDNGTQKPSVTVTDSGQTYNVPNNLLFTPSLSDYIGTGYISGSYTLTVTSSTEFNITYGSFTAYFNIIKQTSNYYLANRVASTGSTTALVHGTANAAFKYTSILTVGGITLSYTSTTTTATVPINLIVNGAIQISNSNGGIQLGTNNNNVLGSSAVLFN